MGDCRSIHYKCPATNIQYSDKNRHAFKRTTVLQIRPKNQFSPGVHLVFIQFCQFHLVFTCFSPGFSPTHHVLPWATELPFWESSWATWRSGTEPAPQPPPLRGKCLKPIALGLKLFGKVTTDPTGWLEGSNFAGCSLRYPGFDPWSVTLVLLSGCGQHGRIIWILGMVCLVVS